MSATVVVMAISAGRLGLAAFFVAAGVVLLLSYRKICDFIEAWFGSFDITRRGSGDYWYDYRGMPTARLSRALVLILIGVFFVLGVYFAISGFLS